MMQLRRDNPPEKMTDKVILENVLGRQSNRLVGYLVNLKARVARTQDDPRTISFVMN